MQTHLLHLPNRDLLSSLCFNSYGTRLAASSLDHHLYVLSSDPATGRWPDEDDEAEDHGPSATTTGGARGGGKKEDDGNGSVQSWNAHDGPVVKVVWTDPVHGEVLASAGSDGTVRIWEEAPAPSHHPAPPSSTSPPSNAPAWHLRSRLLVSRQSVRDLAFSPSDFGLKLACLSADSHLRIYDCLDLSTLGGWDLIVDLDLSAGGGLPVGVGGRKDQLADGGKGNAFASGPPPPPAPAPPASGPASSRSQPLTSIKGFEVGSSSRDAPAYSTSLGALSQAASSSTGSGSAAGGHIESEGGWAMSWCPEHWWGEVMVLASGPSGLIRLVRFGSPPPPSAHSFSSKRPASSATDVSTTAAPGEWNVLKVLAPPGYGPEDRVPPVCSLAWAPPCGRDFHLVASSHRDGLVRIWRLSPPPLSPTSSSSSGSWDVELDAELTTGAGTGSCEWNVTGTVLSTSGAEGKVRIWKRGFNGSWVQVAVVACEDGEEEDGEDGEEPRGVEGR